MKLLDTIKNALFEVEYVEVPDEPKKPKEKKKDKEQVEKDKPIAKKVLLSRPKQKEERKEPDALDTKTDDIVDVPREPEHNFKVMDDNDFKVEDTPHYDPEPISNTYEPEKYPEKEVSKEPSLPSEYERSYVYEKPAPPMEEYYPPKEESHVIYREPVRERYSAPYGIDETSRNLVQEYGKGAYEKKEDKGGFKPSPIISPIYGVLDKNYRKEDVVQKKDVRLSVHSSRENVDVDDVRNKALGVHEAPKVEKSEPVVEKHVEEDKKEEENLFVDLSKEEAKPEVKEVTMGDAMEYFQDLGLEYNVDYVDASKPNSTPRRVKDNYNEEPEMFPIDDEKNSVKEEPKKVEEKKPPVVEDDLDNDDNLFDLIENMYQDK